MQFEKTPREPLILVILMLGEISVPLMLGDHKLMKYACTSISVKQTLFCNITYILFHIKIILIPKVTY